MKPRIVLSGVNLFEGGPLSVYQDALSELSTNFSREYEIIALVHRKELFHASNVRFIEFPKIRRSWLRRIYFEYHSLRKLSEQLDAYLWFSLHDMTPTVHATVQAVYCHNPSPFAKLRRRDIVDDPHYAAFILLYRFLYRINIHRNNYVVVQQAWLRDRFQRLYPVRTVIVAHPRIPTIEVSSRYRSHGLSPEPDRVRFFFPAYPRVFKNAEVLLEAAKVLQTLPIEVWLTFSGDEGKYARRLVTRYGHLPNVKFLGKLTRDQVFDRYEMVDCLVFPSLLETWGLPISEFKNTGKPMLLANLPYARETVGTYANVHFFDPLNSRELALLMRQLSSGTLNASSSAEQEIAPPYAADWRQLFRLLLGASSPR